MPAIAYGQVPTAAQFQRDSGIMLAVRSHDIILSPIDTQLVDYHAKVKLASS